MRGSDFCVASDFFPDIDEYEGPPSTNRSRRDEIFTLHGVDDDDFQVGPQHAVRQSSDTLSSDLFSSPAGCEVYIHVYDMGPVTARLNEFILERANLGAFHVGVEVLDNEWCFQGFHDAWDDPALSGVVRSEPRCHPGYMYRETISMGTSPFCEDDIDDIIDNMVDAWRANSYHLVTRNCVSFAEEFVRALSVPRPFPAWVRGAADAGKSPAIFAIADYGWSW